MRKLMVVILMVGACGEGNDASTNARSGGGDGAGDTLAVVGLLGVTESQEEAWEQLTRKLESCSLLSAGTLGWPGPECRTRCLLEAGCPELEAVVCDSDVGSGALPTCLEACKHTCGDGSRVDGACDGYPDCADGSDEQGCEAFLCSDGETIGAALRCDGEAQCASGSDERGCGLQTRFSCETGESIPHQFVCDMAEDCPGSEDEAGCAVFTCGQ